MKLRIVNFVNKHIGMAGMLHIFFSFAIAKMCSFFLPLWLAFLIALVIGIGGEVYDKLSKKGCADWKDILWDVIGSVLGII